MTAPRDSSSSRHRSSAARRLAGMLPQPVVKAGKRVAAEVTEAVEEMKNAVGTAKQRVEGVKRAIGSKYGD